MKQTSKLGYFEPHELHNYSYINIIYTMVMQFCEYIIAKYIKRQRIIVQCPNLSYSYNKITHSNWGDDLNVLFLKEISEDCILPGRFLISTRSIPFLWLKRCRQYRFIGSVIGFVYNDNTTIWGSGMINEKSFPATKHIEFLSVRGPLTRKCLIEKGYDCPEIYGDPALLLPYYYRPNKKQLKYKLGIIPHYTDYDKPELDKFKSNSEVQVIRVYDYSKWTDVIDEICNCEFIASSSLHGIIASEAYQIPNLWIEICEPIVGNESNRFKFYDFFLSLGQDRKQPYVINDETTLEDLLLQRSEYNYDIKLSIKPMVSVCPFRLKIPLKEFV